MSGSIHSQYNFCVDCQNHAESAWTGSDSTQSVWSPRGLTRTPLRHVEECKLLQITKTEFNADVVTEEFSPEMLKWWDGLGLKQGQGADHLLDWPGAGMEWPVL
jgi:hypothetical protein